MENFWRSYQDSSLEFLAPAMKYGPVVVQLHVEPQPILRVLPLFHYEHQSTIQSSFCYLLPSSFCRTHAPAPLLLMSSSSSEAAPPEGAFRACRETSPPCSSHVFQLREGVIPGSIQTQPGCCNSLKFINQTNLPHVANSGKKI